MICICAFVYLCICVFIYLYICILISEEGIETDGEYSDDRQVAL